MGQLRIIIDKKTGSMRLDHENLSEDRVLEMLRELPAKITHIVCPDLEDDADPRGDRIQRTVEESEQTRIEEER